MDQANFTKTPNIKVIGVGGGGNNTINFLKESGHCPDVMMYAFNTDEQALRNCKADVTLPIGKTITRGLGAGSDPEVGRRAAEESREEIEKILENTDIVFVASGMGGGTGTGAAPEVAKYARDKGILTFAISTTPFVFEGAMRFHLALDGVKKLKANSDVCLIISNQNLIESHGDVYVEESFSLPDSVMETTISGLIELLTAHSQYGRNLDLNHLYNTLQNAGLALVSQAKVSDREKSSAQNFVQAIANAANSEMLQVSVRGAHEFILLFRASNELSLEECQMIPQTVLQRLLGYDNFSIQQIPMLTDTDSTDVEVTLVATKFDNVDETFNRAMANSAKSFPVSSELM